MKNMCFKKAQVEKALRAIALDEGWGLNKETLADFKSTVAKRITTMCRHVSQALCRPKPPAWLSQVLGDAADAQGSDDEADAENKDDDDDEVGDDEESPRQASQGQAAQNKKKPDKKKISRTKAL